MLKLFKKSQFEKLESGKSFTFETNFNDVLHYGVYHKDLGVVAVSYFVKQKNTFLTHNFTLQQAKDRINSKEWTVL